MILAALKIKLKEKDLLVIKEDKMKAHIDRDTCVGSANCTQICPEVFQLEDGKSKVIVDMVPKEVESKCKEAEAGCPVKAISVSE